MLFLQTGTTEITWTILSIGRGGGKYGIIALVSFIELLTLVCTYHAESDLSDSCLGI